MFTGCCVGTLRYWMSYQSELKETAPTAEVDGDVRENAAEIVGEALMLSSVWRCFFKTAWLVRADLPIADIENDDLQCLHLAE